MTGVVVALPNVPGLLLTVTSVATVLPLEDGGVVISPVNCVIPVLLLVQAAWLAAVTNPLALTVNVGH